MELLDRRASWRRSRTRVINVHPALLPAFPGRPPGRGPDRLRSQGRRRDGPLRGRRSRHRTDHLAGGGHASLHSRRKRRSWTALHRSRARAPAPRDPPDRAGCRRARRRQPAAASTWTRASLEGDELSKPDRSADGRAASGRGDLKVERALLTVSDKRGLVDFARALVGARRGDHLHRRHRRRARRRRHRRRARSRTTPASRRSSTAASRRSTPRSTPACWRSARARSTARRSPSTASRRSTSSCVNLYPFERTAARRGVSDEEVIEHIDIGGPTLIRAAAKNHAYVGVVVRPESYDAVIEELRETRRRDLRADARVARDRGVRRDRALRRRDLALVRRARGRLPAPLRGRVREGARPLLRREPAPARRLLRAGRACARTCSRAR